jgi:hypothetical protein
MKREIELLVLQLVLTAVGLLFVIIVFDQAVYVSDFFCCAAILLGILAIREAGRKENWPVRLASLLLMGLNVFTLLVNHVADFIFE